MAIAESSQSPPDVFASLIEDLERLRRLEARARDVPDAVGNLFVADAGEILNLNVGDVEVFIGLFIGAGLPFLFAALTIDAVGRAAQKMIEEVRRQFREIPGILEGTALRSSNIIKFVLYSMLFVAAVYWGFKGDFVDFWDAFLWLVAFFFIEMNVVEWRKEDRENELLAAD